MLTVGFLHTDAGRADFFRRWLAERAPGVVGVHLTDPQLLVDLRQRGLDDELRLRVGARLGELVGRAVDAVVCTCAVLGDEAARVGHHAGIPTVREHELAGERPLAALEA